MALISGKFSSRTDLCRIQAALESHFDLPPGELQKRTRRREVARARQLAIYFARETTDLTLERIARHFGQHHSTAVYAHRVISYQRNQQPELTSFLGKIAEDFEASSRLGPQKT